MQMQKIFLEVVAKRDKGYYAIKENNEVLKEEVIRVFENTDNLLKKRTIEVLIKGLLEAKNYVSHDDVLTICLENGHLVNWIRNEIEYKGYEKLPLVYSMIDELDCRVLLKQKAMRNRKQKMGVDDNKETSPEVVDFATILLNDDSGDE